MKTIFPHYVLLRKHLQGHVLGTDKKYSVILAYVRRQGQNQNKGRKNGKVHTYDTQVSN